MSGASLILNSINKRYNPGTANAVHAVRDFNLTVDAGEIVALLGSSGCGKTSTLRMIAGFEEVSTGTITLADRQIHTLRPAMRNVAMAFEGYSLYPPLTVGENIAFALKSRRLGSVRVGAALGRGRSLAGNRGYPSTLPLINLWGATTARKPRSCADP